MASLSLSEVVEILVQLFKIIHFLNNNHLVTVTITQKKDKIKKSRQTTKKVLKYKQNVLTSFIGGSIIVPQNLKSSLFEGETKKKEKSRMQIIHFLLRLSFIIEERGFLKIFTLKKR